MCKTIKNSYYKKLTFEKLMSAYDRASKNKGNKKDLLKFNIDLETNIVNLLNDLKYGRYTPGKVKTFKIYEPKERVIKSLPFRDRIVQQWYIEEFIKPYIIPRFIYTNTACIENKGTLFAVNILERYMRTMKRERNSYYVLQCDINKYFYSIDKDILYNIMSKYIFDKELLKLTYIFIYEDDSNISINIGNYTSQYYGNIYLHELDKYVKEELKIKYYVRYLDDFILLLKTKEECKSVKDKISNFINNNLHLEFNPKSRYYPSNIGINYCGYRIFETHRLIRNRSKKKIKNNIKKWNKLYLDNKLNINKMIMSFNSWISYSKHSNSYNLRLKMYNRLYYKNTKLLKNVCTHTF